MLKPGLAGGVSGIMDKSFCLCISFGVMQKSWMIVSEVEGKVTVIESGVLYYKIQCFLCPKASNNKCLLLITDYSFHLYWLNGYL